MATCKDFYDIARQWADSGKGYNNGFGYQCIGLIDGLNRALGAGLSTYVRNDEAKNMYYDYASGAYSTHGWTTVAGNPRDDSASKKIWNDLPNGALVFWESSTQRFGHVAVKVGPWGENPDVVQQDGATPNRPAHYFNAGQFTESGGMGFIGAIVSIDSGWGGETPQTKHQDTIPKGTYRENGTFIPKYNVNIRSNNSTNSQTVGVYKKGSVIKYDIVTVDTNGYVWVSYIAKSGKRRYIATGTTKNGRRNDKPWGEFI